MSRYTLLLAAIVSLAATSCTPRHEKMMEGKFEPTWESLAQYGQAPEWFQDAKFGIWAHWGPQCQSGQGDWYAREMYDEGGRYYKWHVENYGHPSEFGFKDVINEWKADKWDPEKLMDLYTKAGAKYFFTLGNHHDNFDLWNSRHHAWNSVNLGPKRDIVARWEKAARDRGLYFGVSIHSSHAWTWYETAQRSDTTGPYKGVPYDGKLTKADGKGKWWEGYDPQELYAQNHPLSEKSEITSSIHRHWTWGNGATPPSEEYCTDFFDRTVDMLNNYKPDLLYYDDVAMPLWPVSDAGMRTVAHYYNMSAAENGGTPNVVALSKGLTTDQKNGMVWDVEMGVPDTMQDKPWQTCTCLGSWHYNQSIYDNDRYKQAPAVVRMLIDIISKNGNMLLSVPIRGNGTIDEKEVKILEGISQWMEINSEGIFGTRVWKIFGEGPVADASNPMNTFGFNENRHKPYTAEDIRFVTKGDFLYAHVMAVPENQQVTIKSLAEGNPYRSEEIHSVRLIGCDQPVKFAQTTTGLEISLDGCTFPSDITLLFEIK